LQVITIVVLVMMQYLMLFLYGVAVMRSIVEEKNSRVIEVILSSATPNQILTGKILGVGAAGLTQVVIWVVIAGVLSTPGLVAARGLLPNVDLPLMALLAFALFFVLGYLLYSTLFAALGAMVNSEQEAQQWQLLVAIPIIIPVVMLTSVIRQPNSVLSVWSSIVPFFAPILMYARIATSTPPVWQVVLSVVLLLFTICAAVALSARIYRTGILMYGKRPTLPEVLKWVRYS
jgi:ABC-2 type transport system permease protein